MGRAGGVTISYRRRAGIALCVALGPLGSVLASTAYFTDGRGLAIEDAWREDKWIYLRLPGGGVLATEASRVARVHLTDPNLEEATAPVPPAPPAPAVFGPQGAPAAAAADPGAATPAAAASVDLLIQSAAAIYELDEKLVRAVVRAESGFNPRAVSRVGAQGLMQLMPATAAEMEVRDPFDPAENLAGGVRYLKWMLQRFDGRLELALAAYNAGPAAVERHGGVPPFAETRAYVRRVLEWARR